MKSKRRKIFYVALSILIAATIWFYVNNKESVTVYVHDVPIEFLNEDTSLADKGLMRISGDEDITVDLKLQMPRNVVYDFDTSELRLVSDLSTITYAGKQSVSYTILYPSKVSSSSVKVESPTIRTVQVEIGELNKKDIEIRCKVVGMRKLGLFPAIVKKKVYKPKPYEQMTYPGQRVQVDVKVVPRRCIADPQLRLYQYTAIDEFTRLRFLAAYPDQTTYASADFLKRLFKWYARRGIQVECVQTDNGFEFTNRFSNSKRDLPTLFEVTASKLGIRHKLIRPYTPRHNGKVERSHREDQKRFYSCHSFYSLDDFAKQLAIHNRSSNNLPMRPLGWRSPSEFTVQHV